MRRMRFAFENMRVGRPPARWALELNALANNVNPDPDRLRPKVLTGCEVAGGDLERLDHYHPPTRDRSTPARANLFLYAAKWLDVGRPEWIDLDKATPRLKRPGSFRRSLLVQRVEDWFVIVGHAPPAWPGADAARREWLDAVCSLLRTAGPHPILLSDPNGLGKSIRRLVPDVVAGGTATEAVHGRGIVLDGVHTPGAVNGVTMLTDHRCALVGSAHKA